MEQIKVADLMNRSVVSTTTETKLSEIVHIMRQEGISSVVVVEESRPVGIVTESDLVLMLSELIDSRCTKQSPVGDFMTNSPVVVEQNTALFDALVVSKSMNVRHLPVVDDCGYLCGILSYSNLARAYERIIEQQRKVIESELSVETRQLREVNDQLKALSMEDTLLGIGNRRSMEVDLSYTHSATMRYGRPYSLVLYDIDCFKQYNDHYGRQAGDDVLRIVTEHIRCEIRQADRIYRCGGERLLLLLPETEYRGASLTANRIVHGLAERNIPHAESPFGVLTISAGVASPEHVDKNQDWRAVLELAGRRLVHAKMNGRNQVGLIA